MTALRLLVVLLTAGTLTTGVTALIVPAEAQRPTARVHDQTYVCTNTVKNGVRVIDARARRGFRDEGVWRWHAWSSISNQGGPLVNLPPNDVGLPGGVSDMNWSFWGGAALTPAQYQRGDPVFKPRAGYTVRRACAPTRARVELSSRGLSGGQASYFDDESRCNVPRRALVRFRVVFVAPVSFAPNRYSGALRTLVATGAIHEVQIAVRDAAGAPLLYLDARSSGSARIFTSRACGPK